MNQAMIKNQFFLINAARTALIALTMVFIQSSAAHANSIGLADQMLMITSSSCPWCEAFEDEVGVGYNNSEEAKYFPIHRHDFFEKMPDSYSDIEPAVMTPTLGGLLVILALSYFGGDCQNSHPNENLLLLKKYF